MTRCGASGGLPDDTAVTTAVDIAAWASSFRDGSTSGVAMKRLYPLLNLAQFLFTLAWSAFWISMALVVLVVTMNPSAPLAMARKFWGPGLRWGALADLQVDPLPDVDWSKPHIFVMNHQSMFDIPAAFIAIPANIRFVAKHVLKYVPFLGWYMWATGMIFVDRSNRARAVASLDLAGKRIREGANILAYPEGTRTKDGSILPFKKGPFVVALKAGVPIIPVAIDGSGKLLPTGGFWLRKGVVRMKFGTPIETAHLTDADRDALMRQVRNAMIDLHVQIGGKGGDKQTAIATEDRRALAS
jgi:1-acyl-sn-glycerol-3-phosphate acyltransferase